MLNILLITLLLIVIIFILLIAIFLIIPIRYPKRTESDYTYYTFLPFWGLYYSHKYLHSPMKRAEKGSNLEKYFYEMNFDFDKSKLKNPKPITIKAVGDLMCRNDLVGEGGKHLWDNIGDYLFDADIIIGNLEFPINPNKTIDKPIQFSYPPEQADVLLRGPNNRKFDIVSLGNNHLNDSLSKGIIHTCNYLDKENIKYVGANRTLEEQDNIPMIELNGVKIAILSYSFSTNGIPLEKDFKHGINLVRFNALDDKDYDPSLIHHHIKLAKKNGANYIISSHHWCIDLEYYPPVRIVKRTHDLLESGIDLIIGHHPHVINPIEHYKTKDNRNCLVFYSLGNLTSHGLWSPIQRMSEIAEVILEAGFDENGNLKIKPTKIIL